MADQTQPTEHFMRDFSNPKTPLEYARLYFTGFAMGAADIVPGVSGGTMAFILGIYETLIDAIKSFDLQALRLVLKMKLVEAADHVSLRFLIALGLGLLTAILLLSSFLEHMLETQPTNVFAFFGGLTLASVVAVGVQVRWNATALISFVIGTVGAYIIVGLPSIGEALGHTPPVLFFSGMIAICAMILPGISGSFLLLVLGQYDFVLGAVKNLDIISLGAVTAGCAIGIMAFSRVLSWLLHHYETPTIALLVGFMIGSLRLVVFRATNLVEGEMPNQIITPLTLDATQIATAIGFVLVGFVLVTVIDHAQSRKNPVVRLFVRS